MSQKNTPDLKLVRYLILINPDLGVQFTEHPGDGLLGRVQSNHLGRSDSSAWSGEFYSYYWFLVEL